MARVLISLTGGDVKQKTVSATDGAFRFDSVPPGDYLVVFQAQGKKKVKRKIPVSTEDVDLGTIDRLGLRRWLGRPATCEGGRVAFHGSMRGRG